VTVRYPWPTFAAPLSCRITDVQLDGRSLPPHLLDEDHRRVRLDEATPWEVLECAVTVSTDEPVPAGIERLIGYVLASSAATNTRMPFPLAPAEDGTLAGRLAVPRSAVSGSLTVTAEAGAQITGRMRVIGTSEPWTFVLERGEAPVAPGAPPFEMAWVDFGASDAPAAARESPTSLAVMDLTAGPRLLLNTGVAGLQALLDNNYAKLERRRLRDILSTTIVRQAISTLIRAAAAEVTDYDDGPPQPPTTALYRQLCQAVADQTSGIAGVEELYEQMVAGRDDTTGNADLWRRIDAAVDTLTGSTDALTTAAKEVANG
jgi:hypothetical protein